MTGGVTGGMSGLARWAVLVGRDLRLTLATGSDAAAALVFFLATVTLVPLALGPEAGLLARIAGGIVWIAALLASLLALDRLVHADHEDGSLDLLALHLGPAAIVAAKAAAHWLVAGLPLLVAAPVMALALGLDGPGLGLLVATLALGTPSLSLIGVTMSMLTLGARRGGALVAALALPLMVPVLIFAAAAIEQARAGAVYTPHLLLLGALLALSLTIAPLAGGAALRQALR